MGPKIVVRTDHVISIECHMYAYLLDIVGISTSDVAIFCPQQVQRRCLFRIVDLEAGLFLTKDPKKNHSDPRQDLTFEQDTIDVWHITYIASECFRSICTAYAYMLSLCAFPPLEPLFLLQGDVSERFQGRSAGQPGHLVDGQRLQATQI